MDNLENLVNNLETLSESIGKMDTEGLSSLQKGIEELEKSITKDDTP